MENLTNYYILLTFWSLDAVWFPFEYKYIYMQIDVFII